jgi:ABC-type transporter Mla MlaB component
MMHPRPYAIEAHLQAATLYLDGTISVARLLEAIRQCEQLPETVWILRVELRSPQAMDAGTWTVLLHALRRWREARSGVTQLSSPVPTGVRERLMRRHRARLAVT